MILLVSSSGGHWLQLQRLLPCFDAKHVILASTYAQIESHLDKYEYVKINDLNRNDLSTIFKNICSYRQIEAKFSPKIVISTGAAPGLLALIYWKLLRRKVYWLDSIANFEKLSLSGKIALFFRCNVLTQWEHLANDKIRYVGAVI